MRTSVHIAVLLVSVTAASTARCQRYNLPPEGSYRVSGYQISERKTGEIPRRKVLMTVSGYIQDQTRSGGLLMVRDPLAGRTRRLIFVKLEREVRGVKDGYAVRAIFRDADNGQILGVDIYAQTGPDGMEVSGTRIKNVGGRERGEQKTGKLDVD
ncbi:MAG: hypothetical protein GF392_02920 [Candidatus Omnitrophica bacterium]|nr:hypothetical protein [Candidatus Omnitrophota bacterium]